jgi:hypothetical protein
LENHEKDENDGKRDSNPNDITGTFYAFINTDEDRDPYRKNR